MKAIAVKIIETFEPNPEDCIPYDGTSVTRHIVTPETAKSLSEDDSINAIVGEEVDVPSDFVDLDGFYVSRTEYEYALAMEEFMDEFSDMPF